MGGPVILVPRREGFADRDRLWWFCRPKWQTEFPHYPIVEGHHDTGLFNRSAAINTAATLAGDWDVAVIIDSDVLIDPLRVEWGIEEARKTGCLVVPFFQRNSLSYSGTQRILGGYRGSWNRLVLRRYTDQHSGVICVPRSLYDRIGGFDEGFSGWGLEDTAFAIACEMEGRSIIARPDGEVWHLYHKTAPEQKHGSASHAANLARANLYRTAQQTGDFQAIQALVREGRAMESRRTQGTIPRIFHRVVPVATPEIAERWWMEFGALHPGWQMVTHRDPLDPAKYPLTSPYWDAVENGAQLADLVRLEVLLRHGGIYVDQDVQPFRSFEPLLPLAAFAAWEDDKVVPNAVMGARPAHPAIREALDRCIAAQRRGTWAAGPGVTTAVFTERDDVLLLPPESFYDVHYRDPDRDTKMQSKPKSWTFARHHYWGSWLEPERQRVPA